MNFIKYWLPVLFWIGIIFILSSGSFSSSSTSRFIEPILRFLNPAIVREELDNAIFIIRKSAHITEYFILGLLLFRAFRKNSIDKSNNKVVIVSLVVVIIIAIGDEFHQSSISTRTGSFFDVGFDTMGGLIAQIVCVVKQKLLCIKKLNSEINS